MGYTVTEKGTITIPAEVRRKLGLIKGPQVDFVETEEGVLMIPLIPFGKLKGIDRDKRKVIYEMIHEIQKERAREAVEQE